VEDEAGVWTTVAQAYGLEQTGDVVLPGPANSGYPVTGVTDDGQQATWLPYDTTNPNKSVTQWGYIRLHALQAWNEFNWNGTTLVLSSPLYKEYLIGKYMNKRGKNFMSYTCFFQCNDHFKEYKPSNIKKYLCNGKGDELKILIMPFYKLGNFKDFFSNIQNDKILKSCTAQILASYLFAYNKLGFLHNDCHLGNILIDEEIENEIIYEINGDTINVPVFGYKILIMDYESSIFDFERQSSQILIKDLFKITSEIIHKNEIDDYIRNTNIEINNLIKTKKYTDLIDITKKLINSI
jgi:hypothetical protein